MNGNNLQNMVYNKAKKVYGDPLSENIKKQLEWEFMCIKQKHMEDTFITATKITSALPTGEWIPKGQISCSMVAFLLGITDIEPLLFHLQPEFYFGFDDEYRPDIELGVTHSQFNKIPDNQRIYKVTVNYEYREHEPEVKLLDSRYCELLHMLSQKTSVPTEQINLNDETITEYLATLEKNEKEISFFDALWTSSFRENGKGEDLIYALHPKTFDDFVKIYAAMQGTDNWYGPAEDMVKANVVSISDFLATRDDVYDLLIHSGLEHETALKIAWEIQRGHSIDDRLEEFLDEHNVSNLAVLLWLGDGYLWPRSDAIAYMQMFCRLVYYRIHYRNIFEICMDTVILK